MYSCALVDYKHPLNSSTLKKFLDELKNSNYIKTVISNKNMLYAAFINNNSLHLDVIDMKELISLYKQHQNIDSFNTIPTTELFPIY
ncbi:MAG: hypothetical protein EKK64_11130 [Neisseriaceae bacterium]|nr:MAG: hypothetical protein EKK64_11130 [Neisseriaceae bacterium]